MNGGGKGTCLSILFYLIWLNWPIEPILADISLRIGIYLYVFDFFVLVPS